MSSNQRSKISSLELYNVCAHNRGIVVVDCRPMATYMLSHVRNAQHVSCAKVAGFRVVAVLEENEEMSETEQEHFCSDRNAKSMATCSEFAEFSRLYPFLCHGWPQSSDERQRQRQQCLTHLYPSEIVEGLLFLGGVAEAADEEVVGNLEIDVIVSLMLHQDLPPWPQYKKRCVHHHFDIADDPDADISQFFGPVHRIVDQCIAAGKRVLVHCKAGRSRSACVLVAALMRINNASLAKSHAIVLNARPNVAINPGFWRQLQVLEHQLRESSCKARNSNK